MADLLLSGVIIVNTIRVGGAMQYGDANAFAYQSAIKIAAPKCSD